MNKNDREPGSVHNDAHESLPETKQLVGSKGLEYLLTQMQLMQYD
jgi:hypothetical protein